MTEDYEGMDTELEAARHEADEQPLADLATRRERLAFEMEAHTERRL